MPQNPADGRSDAVPMTREELQETVASTICCHTRMSPAVQWEIDLLMGAVDKHVALRLNEADESARRLLAQRQEMAAERYAWQERGDRAEAENARLREELRKAKRAANLLAADHRAVERVQAECDAIERDRSGLDADCESFGDGYADAAARIRLAVEGTL